MPGLKSAVLILAFFAFGSSGADAEANTHRVLFVGNSYTFYNSMPSMFEALAEAHSPDQQIETRFIGGGGATLEKHWEVGQALAAIQTGAWDYVVLQGQSSFGARRPSDAKGVKQFHKYVRIFEKEIRDNGGQTVLFMTWSRQDAQDQQEHLAVAYQAIGQELGCKVAPVGVAWDQLRDNRALELYDEDGSHPSVVGSYLAAMIILATISGDAPEASPGLLTGYEILWGGEIAGQKSTLCDLPEPVVRLLETAVK